MIRHLLQALFLLMLMACDGSAPAKMGDEERLTDDTVKVAAAPAPAPTPEQMRLWANSCALCHVAGVGGAPRLGVAEEWQSRISNGQEALLQNTLEGINNMPPLGYCMACEKDDFIALIDFMSGAAQ